MQGNKSLEDGSSAGGSRTQFDVSKSKLNTNAAVFVPRTAPVPQQQAIPVEQTSRYTFIQGTPQDWVEQASEFITRIPDDFDEVMAPLTESLNAWIKNVEGPELVELHLQDMVEIIFKRAVEDTRFRFVGAKMCNHFSHNLLNNKHFRSNLLKRCQQEHKKRKELAENADTLDRLIGYSLFTGELMVNLTHEVGNAPLKFLAIPIGDLLTLLLDYPESEVCIKCVMQLLKMTGALIEDAEKDENDGKAEKMDKTFEKIKELLDGGKLSRRSTNMMTFVVTLRSRDWGRTKELDKLMNGEHGNFPYVAEDGTHFFVYPPPGAKGRSQPPPQQPPASKPQPPPASKPQPQPPASQPRPTPPPTRHPPPREPWNNKHNGDAPPEIWQQVELDPSVYNPMDPSFLMQPPPPTAAMPGAFMPTQMPAPYNLPPGDMGFMPNDMQFFAGPEGDYPSYSQDDEMDEEMAAAFEEFLRDTNQ